MRQLYSDGKYMQNWEMWGGEAWGGGSVRVGGERKYIKLLALQSSYAQQFTLNRETFQFTVDNFKSRKSEM